jgi:integrase/recombinase XerC
MLDEYLRYLAAERRTKATIRIRSVYVSEFLTRFPHPGSVTPNDITVFFTDNADRWSDGSRNVVLSSIRNFYKWGIDFEHFSHDPTRNLHHRRVSQRPPRIALDDAVREGLRAARPNQRAALLLMAEAGMRREEVATLLWKNVMADTVHVYGKGQKWRVVPLTNSVIAALEMLPRRSIFVFPGRISGHMSTSTIMQWTYALTGFPPHALRRGYATRLYEKCRDIHQVQKMLGHASPVTTEKYIGASQSSFRLIAEMVELGESSVA